VLHESVHQFIDRKINYCNFTLLIVAYHFVFKQIADLKMALLIHILTEYDSWYDKNFTVSIADFLFKILTLTIIPDSWKNGFFVL
jgi:hypothetical protein